MLQVGNHEGTHLFPPQPKKVQLTRLGSLQIRIICVCLYQEYEYKAWMFLHALYTKLSPLPIRNPVFRQPCQLKRMMIALERFGRPLCIVHLTPVARSPYRSTS